MKYSRAQAKVILDSSTRSVSLQWTRRITMLMPFCSFLASLSSTIWKRWMMREGLQSGCLPIGTRAPTLKVTVRLESSSGGCGRRVLVFKLSNGTETLETSLPHTHSVLPRLLLMKRMPLETLVIWCSIPTALMIYKGHTRKTLSLRQTLSLVVVRARRLSENQR